MKNAFTMIELIFVIVILGILAAVAIPKLAATRDDAQVSKMAQNIGTSIEEIASYTISKGTADSNFALMSNAMKKMQSNGDATLSANKAVISIGGVDCVNVNIVKNATNDDLNVSFISSGNSKCLSLQNSIDVQNYAMKLRGTSVTY